MSSHHIVRDEQEPALILHHLSLQDTATIHPLLEWSPVVVCCQDSIDLYTSMNHKLDFALVGLTQMEKWKETLADQFPIRLIAVHGEDFLKTGLMVLSRDGHSAVNIVTSEEAVPEVVAMAELWAAQLNVVIFAGGKRHLFINANTYRKWLPAGSTIQLWSLGAAAKWQVNAAGLGSKEKEGTDLEITTHQDGYLEVSCSRPSFMVVEDL